MSQALAVQPVATPPPFLPVTFETFGKYILLKKLGTGGMAEIFLARPATIDGNGRVAVIKRILPHMAEDPTFVNMFRAEVQVMMGFNHPHLVQLHDFGDVKGQTYIAMEYIEGKTLKEIISTFKDKKELIPVPMALSLVAQAATGLSYAHGFENRVTGEVFNAIHRDISPQNLILSYDGNLKVIDFGIAKAEGGMAERTQSGIIKGKVAYLSPEQIQGHELDGRSDIFSLGIVAWELLTSKRPFSDDKDNEMTIMQKIEKCDQVIVPPSTFNKEVPPAVDALIMKALRRNPNDRYASAHAFQTAIRQVMRQHYPTYSYADTGELVRVLFEKEITQERVELRAVNDKAQKFLTPDTSEVTVASTGILGDAVVRGLSSIIPNMTESRVANIEALMRQKATTKHYALFAIYFVSLVALKLDDRYALLDRLFGLPQTQQMVVYAPVAKRPVVAQAAPVAAPPVAVARPAAPPVRAIASVPARATTTAAKPAANAKSGHYYTRNLKKGKT